MNDSADNANGIVPCHYIVVFDIEFRAKTIVSKKYPSDLMGYVAMTIGYSFPSLLSKLILTLCC